MKYWKLMILTAAIFCLISDFVYGQEYQFMYGDSMRSYIVYEPSLEPNPDGYPLIIGLHGAGSDGYTFIVTAGLVLKANAEKFIVACPNSLHYPLAWWNGGGLYERITDGTDDSGFIAALIDTMILNYNVDPTRVYVMGFSNGSAMAYRVAAELSHKIAAMGVSSGQMLYEYCDPEFPVPIIHFHGLSDNMFPYYGRDDSTNYIPPVDSTMAIWREINGCGSTADTLFNENGVIGIKWASSTGLSDIILYTNQDGEHEWPRPANWDLSATDLIWDFIKGYNRIVLTNVEEENTQPVSRNFKLYQNYPNPFNSSTMIKYQLSRSDHISLNIYDPAGRKVVTLVNKFQPAGTYEIYWHPERLSSGLYFLKIQDGEFSETRKFTLLK